MEQYAHLLIAADPDFVPDPAWIAAFLDLIQRDFQFQYAKSKENWMPGLRLYNSAEIVRTMSNSFTGEKRSITVPKWFELEQISEIEPLIAGEPKFGVTMSGTWPSSHGPIRMLLSDQTPFEQDPTCFVACVQRAKAVCTGDWWGDEQSSTPEFGFDDPNGPIQSTGVFTHPWTGIRFEVTDAGSARFWIEFEFGKWLFPQMTDSFDLLRPDLVEAVQNCFGTHFVQAGRGTG